MPRKKEEPLDRTSSLNKYVLCNRCDGKFRSKYKLIRHECVSALNKLICKWCNVKFPSRACLANHARIMHGELCYSKLSNIPSSQTWKCEVCAKAFAEFFQLRYHIRRQHFNLKAPLPYWLQKKVNQVWFENVLNSSTVLEIRKASPTRLVLRRLAPDSSVRVPARRAETLDVTHLYLTGRRYEPVECNECGKTYGKRDLNKHKQEVHGSATRRSCNKCHMRFKRHYIFLKHACGAKRKPRGVRRAKGGGFVIASVESLAKGGGETEVGSL